MYFLLESRVFRSIQLENENEMERKTDWARSGAILYLEASVSSCSFRGCQ